MQAACLHFKLPNILHTSDEFSQLDFFRDNLPGKNGPWTVIPMQLDLQGALGPTSVHPHEFLSASGGRAVIISNTDSKQQIQGQFQNATMLIAILFADPFRA